MQHHAFSHLSAGDSPLHHLAPRVKVILATLFILATVLIPDGAWAAFFLTLVVILALARWAELTMSFVFKRALIILPFTLTALTTLFIAPGTPLAVFHIGPWTLTATEAGAIRFVSILIRSILSVMIAILLTATTSYPDLLHAFRHLRMPRALVGILAFMYRYLFVLSDEATRLMRARQARSARQPDQPGRNSLFWRGKVTGNMVGQLFLRSLERGERVHQAMLARGFRGHIYTLNPHSITSLDRWFAALAVLVILIIQLIAYAP